jgi:hypothetical protein
MLNPATLIAFILYIDCLQLSERFISICCVRSCGASCSSYHEVVKRLRQVGSWHCSNRRSKKNRLFCRFPASTSRDMPPATPDGRAGRTPGRAGAARRVSKRTHPRRRQRSAHRRHAGHRQSLQTRTRRSGLPSGSCQVFWGAGDELGKELPVPPFVEVRHANHAPNQDETASGPVALSSTTCSGLTRYLSSLADGWREPLGRCTYCSSELVRIAAGGRPDTGLLWFAVGADGNPVYCTDGHCPVCRSDR